MTSPSTTLPDDLVEALADLYATANPKTGKRWTSHELAALASVRLDRPIAHTTVMRAIRPLLSTRADVTREVLRAKIGERLGAQLDTLDDLLTKIGNDARDAESPYQRALSTDTYRKALESKLRFSGIAERVEVQAEVHVDAAVSVTDARDELAESLAREAAGPARRRAAGAAGDPAAGDG